MASPIVTLTTDFGHIDPFVGAMKGVILGINPGATIVDLTHEVPPQDVLSGAYLFDSVYRYLPQGTVHVVVVDPGVGTRRRPIAIRSPAATFVCPDNGLLSYALQSEGGPEPDAEAFATAQVRPPEGWQAYHLTERRFWHEPVSNTFDGRDIFAPVAGHLSAGDAPEAMGPLIDTMTAFRLPQPHERDGSVAGRVLHVDRFGNLITNVGASLLPASVDALVVEVGGTRISGLSTSYQAPGALVALIGSNGRLEIAMPNGDAARMLGVGVGAEVSVLLGS